LAALVVVIAACTERLVVHPEGEFSWEPQGQMIWPIDGAVVSGYHDAARPSHSGIDLAARAADPVAAVAAGRVAAVGSMRGFGNVIALTHANGLTTVYAHLALVRVTKGAEVLRGQTIGTIGEESYLHYEVRDAQGSVDPMTYYATSRRPIGAGVSDVRERVANEPAEMGAIGGQPEISPSATAPARRPTAPPTRAPTLVPTYTATPWPTLTPTPTLTPEPTLTPTSEPTLTPTPAPTLIPRPIPTLTPTPIPTFTPTRVVTRTPTVAPLTTRRREPTRRPEKVAPPTPTPIPPTPVPTAEPEPRESVWGGVAFGTALVGTNLLYVPAKLTYAAVGTVIGGVVLVLAHDREVAAEVWWPSLGGDYFITAEQLRGEEPIHFMGSSSETPEPPAPR
jgi:hypothetical protein